MNYSFISAFFVDNGISTLIISAIVTAIGLIIEKLCKGISPKLKNYSPLLAVVIAYLYDMIFIGKCFRFSKDAFYSGLIACSFATAVKMLINKIKNGDKSVYSEVANIVTAIISELTLDDSEKTAIIQSVISLFGSNLPANEIQEKIEKTIIENTKDYDCVNYDAFAIAEKIVNQTKKKDGEKNGDE